MKKRGLLVLWWMFFVLGACAARSDSDHAETATEASLLACDPDADVPCAPRLMPSVYGTEIALTWRSTGGAETEWYELERRMLSPVSTNYALIFEADAYQNGHSDTVPPGNFSYRIRACNWIGCSPYTATSVTAFLPYLSFGSVSGDPAGLVIGGTFETLGQFDVTARGIDQDLQKVMVGLAIYNPVQPYESLSLYADDGAFVAGPVPMSENGAFTVSQFSGFHFPVKRNATRRLTVKGIVKTVGTAGAPTGTSNVLMLFNGDGTPQPDTGSFESRGTYPSGAQFTSTSAGGQDAYGTLHVARKARPVFTAVPIPGARLTNGKLSVTRFMVTAQGGPVSFKTFGFDMYLSDNGGVPLKIRLPALKQVDTGAEIPTFSDILPPGCEASRVTKMCIFRITTVAPQVIPAGESRIYDLSVTLEGADGHFSDWLTTGLHQENNVHRVTGELHRAGSTVPNVYAEFALIDDLDGDPDAPDFSYHAWSDMSAGGIATLGDVLGVLESGSKDWTNGIYLPAPAPQLLLY